MSRSLIPTSSFHSYSDGSFHSSSGVRAVLDQEESSVPAALSNGIESPARLRATLETTFRHSGWLAPRTRIWEAMDCPEITERRRAAFATCGSAAWIVRHPDHPERLSVVSCHCHDRFCVPCASEKGALVANNVLRHSKAARIRFITLTIRHVDQPLSDQLDFLIASFRRLRASKLWQIRTTGGVSFLEVKLAEDGHHWHPHLHILQEGRYVPHRALSDEWRKITRTSFVVHIKEPKGRRDVIHYVTKYASKPLGMALTLHADKLREAMLEMRSRRLMTTFGSWRGFRLTERPDSVDWLIVAPLSDVMLRGMAGEPWALALLLKLRGNSSCLKLLKLSDRPPRSPPACACG